MTQQPPEWGSVPPPPPPPPPGNPPGPGTYVDPQFQPAMQPQYVMAPRTDGFAIASLCCSLGFLVISCLGIVTSILAIVFAAKARRRISESNGMLTGEGLAKAGLIVGWVGIGLWVVGVVFYALFFILVIANSDSSNALGFVG